MPRPGGEADKLGNRYEGLWVVDAALDLIDGEFVDLVVEAVGDEAAGVEFFRTNFSRVLANTTQSSGSRLMATGRSAVWRKGSHRPAEAYWATSYKRSKKAQWESSVQEPALLN